MKTVLLTRHAETETPGSSLYKIFSEIEQIVEQNYNAIKMKVGPWSKRELETWILENAFQTDLLITSDPYALKILRENGWRGKTIFTALGGFPRGAANFRGAMPYLHPNDVIWFNSTADMEIYFSLVVQDGTQPVPIYIPYSMDEKTFRPLNNRDTRQTLRDTWGFKPNDFVLVYTGRVTIEKNVHATIEVVSELTRLGYPVKLAIVGQIEDTPFREFQMHPVNVEGKIKAQIEVSDVSEHVIIQEWQIPDKLNEGLNAADAFINLTLHHDENFGLSQIEAMSAGLPVIGTAWGGLQNTIIDKEVGFSVDTWVTTNGIRFDAPAVMSAIKCLIENKARREAQGQRAREHAVRNYNTDLYRENVEQLIEIVINRPTQHGHPSFTPFGSKFHQRFVQKGYPVKHSKIARTSSPVYDRLSDPDYMMLITPYTSRTEHKIKNDTLLFQAITGHPKGNFFVSEDLLYSIRIPISSEEADVINQLSRWQCISRSSLNHADELLYRLIQKGMLGISKEIQ